MLAPAWGNGASALWLATSLAQWAVAPHTRLDGQKTESRHPRAKFLEIISRKDAKTQRRKVFNFCAFAPLHKIFLDKY